MIYEGILSAKGRRFALVVSRFNDFITSKLRDGAIDCLVRHQGKESDIDTYWTPGAFEIPLVARKVAETGRYDAVICLGLVMRGDTKHNEYIANAAAKGIGQVGLETGLPVIFGILTTDSLEQAIERAGTKAGNRGWDAALSAIETIDLLSKIPAGTRKKRNSSGH